MIIAKITVITTKNNISTKATAGIKEDLVVMIFITLPHRKMPGRNNQL